MMGEGYHPLRNVANSALWLPRNVYGSEIRSQGRP